VDPVRRAGVDALGRVGESEVPTGGEARFGLEDRPDHVLGGAGIRRRLQHHQDAGSQGPSDLLGGRQDHREIGRPVGERGRQAEHDDVDVAERRRRVAEDGVAERLDLGIGDVHDVGTAVPEGPDLRGVLVDADDRESRLVHRGEQRQPDVAEPDDGGHGIA
jgi:hypothetical protein